MVIRDGVQAHNVAWAERVKEENLQKRKGSNGEIQKAMERGALLLREAKRQGAMNDPRRFAEIRQKVLDRNPSLRPSEEE